MELLRNVPVDQNVSTQALSRIWRSVGYDATRSRKHKEPPTRPETQRCGNHVRTLLDLLWLLRLV